MLKLFMRMYAQVSPSKARHKSLTSVPQVMRSLRLRQDKLSQIPTQFQPRSATPQIHPCPISQMPALPSISFVFALPKGMAEE